MWLKVRGKKMKENEGEMGHSAWDGARDFTIEYSRNGSQVPKKSWQIYWLVKTITNAISNLDKLDHCK